MAESPKRQEAFDKFYKMVEAEKEVAEGSLKGTSRDMQEASHASESRFDTFREEAEFLHAGYQKKLVALRELLTILNTIRADCMQVTERVLSGSMVELEDVESQEISRMYLIPQGGGRKINVDGNEYTAVAPDSRMGKMITGKEIGDVVLFVSENVRRQMEISKLE